MHSGPPHHCILYSVQMCRAHVDPAQIDSLCTSACDRGGQECRAGIVLCDNFVFKEGGEVFPRRCLGALALQCVREAVYALGGLQGRDNPGTESTPPPLCSE